ncbi:uncharacterized protein B0H64DRAFT_385520 [Chaetomium fimeti]|uniref:Protein kinase domain-containing protein n=1 Tax=Chaetomium fimeti TaxID=1854472 RepID=A0AAE0HL70_9PEZI|nr:hypothetical protein B0H64DRAFT_385520 [Chaetomium fimeti]
MLDRFDRLLQFTLGRSTIVASGESPDRIHDNVLRLHIHRTPFDDFLYSIFSRLPLVVLIFLTPVFPQWALPRTFILKEQKPDWDEEFENEKRMYARLRTLQGSVIPICFGEASVEGRRALVLSDVGRITLCDPPSLERDRDEMANMIDDAFRAITKLGVEHGDIKLDNFHLVSTRAGDKIMIVDLESVTEIGSHRAPERAMIYPADRLYRYWRDAVESDRREKEEERRQRARALPNPEQLRRLKALGDARRLAINSTK